MNNSVGVVHGVSWMMRKGCRAVAQLKRWILAVGS